MSQDSRDFSERLLEEICTAIIWGIAVKGEHFSLMWEPEWEIRHRSGRGTEPRCLIAKYSFGASGGAYETICYFRLFEDVLKVTRQRYDSNSIDCTFQLVDPGLYDAAGRLLREILYTVQVRRRLDNVWKPYQVPKLWINGIRSYRPRKKVGNG